MKVQMKKTAAQLLEEIRKRENNSSALHIKASSKVSMTSEECKGLCSKIGLNYKEGFEDRVIMFRMTDATADRHDEVILPEGVNIKEFKKDPVILLQHNSWTYPIGKSLDTYYDKENNDIVGKVLFFDDETDRTGVSEDTFRMVTAGALKSGSIGFRAKHENVRLASPDEQKKFKLSKFGIIFDKIELREFSIVTIPANPNATQISARKGMYRNDTLEALKEHGLSEEDYKILFDEEETDNNEDETTEIEIENGSDVSTDTDSIENNNNAEEGEEKTNLSSQENEEEKSGALKIIIHIDTKTLTDELVSKKIKWAEDLQAKGRSVDLIIDGIDQDEVIKAGAVLNKKNKERVQKALNSINELRAGLEDLLSTADPKSESKESDPDPEQKDEGEEEKNEEVLYSIFDNATEELSNIS